MLGTRSVLLEAKQASSQKKIRRALQAFKFRQFLRTQLLTKRSATKQKSMTFLLNPYDKELDISTKEGLQLYGIAKKGLEKEDRFDGTKEKYSKFVKLMGKAFKTYRMKNILKVPTSWEAGVPANPTKEGIVDLFESNTLTRKQVNAQADKVWSESKFGATTPEYFKIFATKPTDDASLDAERNATKFKHAMAGANIWNSLTSDFQLELLGQEAEFAKENEYDGLQLWHHIRTEVNPSTKVGACALKEEIESKTLQHFG